MFKAAISKSYILVNKTKSLNKQMFMRKINKLLNKDTIMGKRTLKRDSIAFQYKKKDSSIS